MKIWKETIEWRIIATFLDFVIIYLYTGVYKKAGILMIILCISKTIAYYIHRKIRT